MRVENLIALQEKSRKKVGRPNYTELYKRQVLAKWRRFSDVDWPKFKKSNEYGRMFKSLTDAGIKMPYSENIIYRIFYSGYFNQPFIK